MSRERMYKPDLDHESRWYARGPSGGQSYYGGTLYPETRVESKEAAERDARMLDEAYWQGFRDALRNPDPRGKGMSDLVQKLRYMGRQYAAGQVARGGGSSKHYLEEAADEIEALRARQAVLIEERDQHLRWRGDLADRLGEVEKERDALAVQLNKVSARQAVLVEALTDAIALIEHKGGNAKRQRAALAQGEG